MNSPAAKPPRATEQGFMLVGLIVAIFLILLVLGVAAPRLAKSLRREREVEAVRRGNQYVRAIQLFYRKTGHYPGSIDQLEKTNNIRFLRQRYVDPMTGKPDWRLIHAGEAKTTVKGFFGKPLAGLPGAGGGLGSVADMVSSGQAGAGAAGTTNSGSSSNSTFGSSSFGSSSGSGSSSFGSAGSGSSSFGSSSGSSSFGSNPGATGTAANSGSSFGSATGTGAGASNGISSQSATSFSGTGAPIIGVGSSAPGDSIIVLNEQTTYPTWEFLYDPRVEQLKAKAGLLGGPASASGTSSTGTSSFGSSIGGTPGGTTSSPSTFGGTSTPTTGTPTTTPP